MSMQPVRSSNIAAVDYDAETQTLTVQFHHGRSYRYANVPQEVADAIVDPTLDSVGKYFNEHIKDQYAAS